MTFIEIYNRIITYWRDQIDFADGVIFEPEHKTPGTTPNGSESFRSRTFSSQWDSIEHVVGFEDTFGDLMVWTMYQVFHRHAVQLFRKNVFSLNPKDISKDEIEEQFFSNLNNEGWEAELAEYERIR